MRQEHSIHFPSQAVSDLEKLSEDYGLKVYISSIVTKSGSKKQKKKRNVSSLMQFPFVLFLLALSTS